MVVSRPVGLPMEGGRPALRRGRLARNRSPANGLGKPIDRRSCCVWGEDGRQAGRTTGGKGQVLESKRAFAKEIGGPPEGGGQLFDEQIDGVAHDPFQPHDASNEKRPLPSEGASRRGALPLSGSSRRGRGLMVR